jgi:hypothetical protein
MRAVAIKRGRAARYMAIENWEGIKPLVELLTICAFSALQHHAPRWTFVITPRVVTRVPNSSTGENRR